MLLCRNHRGEWELPGGRPYLAESYEDCVVREVHEETGLDVVVNRLLGSTPFEVIPGTMIDVVAYDCTLPPSPHLPALHPSHEHTTVAFLELEALAESELPSAYRRLIALHCLTGPPADPPLG